MLVLKIQDVHKLFYKENYTGKKIIDPDADDLILEEALKRKDYTQIKISIIVQDKFTPEEEQHFKDKFKEFYLRKVEELTKHGKRQDRKHGHAFRKGLLILIIYLLFAFVITRISDLLATLLGEIAIIAGWVALWKPFDYYIYQRPDHNHLKEVCENLTKVDVELIHEEYKDSVLLNISN